MAILLGPLPEVVEHKARQWFVRLNARKWRQISWHNLTDMEKRAIDRMCTCGVAQQRVREVFEVDGAEHTLRAILSGDCADRFGAEYYEQMIAHFGRGRNITTRMEMEMEAIRLTAAGQAIRERNNLREDLSTALNGSYFPAPGCVEWLGWEISDPPPVGDEKKTSGVAVGEPVGRRHRAENGAERRPRCCPAAAQRIHRRNVRRSYHTSGECPQNDQFDGQREARARLTRLSHCLQLRRRTNWEVCSA